MQYDDDFFRLSLVYSSTALFVLPIVGCFFASCPASDGQRTVSEIVSREPLATFYAYYGAILLFVVFYCQTEKTNGYSHVFTALLGAKCLSVPLVLPLSNGVDSVHGIFFLAGGFAETMHALGIIIAHTPTGLENSKGGTRRANRAFRSPYFWYKILFGTQVALCLVGLVSFFTQLGNPWVYLVLEYVFGCALVASALIQHLYLGQYIA
jgi:magnesium-transporting ATPase (P-type)